ncbi:MAG: squalene/phytoene synthase family protein [Alphaproteobacteria bacterium]|nr:squalene/phytoene synthase family protein [Alphaproteobacteria bacterium]
MMEHGTSEHMPSAHDAEQTLSQHGKSFAWARRLLGKTTGYNAARLYQFCRLIDDLADDDDHDHSSELQALKQAILDDIRQGHPIYADLSELIKEMHLPRPVLAALIDGLIADQQTVLFAREDELIRYGYHVAGTVGLLMCPVLGCHDRRAFAFAVDLGIAMQLTNIARDVLDDAKIGRRYLPAEWMAGLTPEQIVAAAAGNSKADIEHRGIIGGAVKRCLDLADQYYLSGEKGMVYLPIRAHLAIAVAGRVYRQIGVQLRKAEYQWHNGRQVTSTATKIRVSCLTLPRLWSRFHGVRRYLGWPKHHHIHHQNHLHKPLQGLPLIEVIPS